MRTSGPLTPRDRNAVEAFANFMSWGETPPPTTRRPGDRAERAPVTEPMFYEPRAVPPAWWAYAWGGTTWCPPEGEL